MLFLFTERAVYHRGEFSEQDECRRLIPPSLLCACADCGVGSKWSEGAPPIRGASLRTPVEQEEECLRSRSMRGRFWRAISREMNSREMGTLWDAFGPMLHSGPGDPSGCGLQRVVKSVFSRDRVRDEEEKHRCILHFPSLREFFTHEAVEHALVQLGWKPLTRRGGWRRYFKIEEPTLPYGLPTIAKLPGRSFVDAPKPIILDFVKLRRLFVAGNMGHLNFEFTVAWDFVHDEVCAGHCLYGTLHRISIRQIDESEGGQRQTANLAGDPGHWFGGVRCSASRTW